MINQMAPLLGVVRLIHQAKGYSQRTTNNLMKPKRTPLEKPTQGKATRVFFREKFSCISYIRKVDYKSDSLKLLYEPLHSDIRGFTSHSNGQRKRGNQKVM